MHKTTAIKADSSQFYLPGLTQTTAGDSVVRTKGEELYANTTGEAGPGLTTGVVSKIGTGVSEYCGCSEEAKLKGAKCMQY